jgi:hypothetical protein
MEGVGLLVDDYATDLRGQICFQPGGDFRETFLGDH